MLFVLPDGLLERTGLVKVPPRSPCFTPRIARSSVVTCEWLDSEEIGRGSDKDANGVVSCTRATFGGQSCDPLVVVTFLRGDLEGV